MRGALERNEFVVHYQPKISVVTREVVGAEALIRWQHPGRGLLTPAEFMAVLANCGLVVPVGKWVFLEVCRQMAAWLEEGSPVVPVSVNLSARQLLRRTSVRSSGKHFRSSRSTRVSLNLRLLRPRS